MSSESHAIESLRKEIANLTATLAAGMEQRKTEFEWFQAHLKLATKHDLEQMEKRIMSAISDFAAKQTAFNDRLDTAITGVTGDVAELNRMIKELQDNPGPISPEDQATLDALQARGEAVTAKLEALDALTPPAVPTP